MLIESASLAIERDEGLYWLVGNLGALVDEVPSHASIIGVGDALLVAMSVAASIGKDAAFIRSRMKSHGSGRIVDGIVNDKRNAFIIASSAAEIDMARGLGFSIIGSSAVSTIYPTRGQAAICLHRSSDVSTPVVRDFASRAPLLRGKTFIRSSGESVDYYYETLEAAHSYDVAVSLGARWKAAWIPDTVVGVMRGGVYLACVIAAMFEARAMMIDPDHEYPNNWASAQISGRVLFVDDLVNSGHDFGVCKRLAHASGAQEFGYLVLYAFAERRDNIIVGATLRSAV